MTLRSGCDGGKVLDPSIESVIDHLPNGLLALAGRYWREAEARLATIAPTGTALSDASMNAGLTRELVAPLVLEPSWPPPVPPRPVAGGWVHCEILDDELPAFEAATEGRTELGPEGFARFCQELRFPVVPYRQADQATDPDEPVNHNKAVTSPPSRVTPSHQSVAGNDQQPLAGRLVVDLSTHWAGPLCTRLLGLFGASVIKIDPECRPDGFGQRPHLFQHLNGKKQRRDYDLRDTQDRALFETLLTEADVVVESFSRRVMTNLGYAPAELWSYGPKVSLLSFKAFPVGTPEQDWLAYGPGVHAASGLAFGHRAVGGRPDTDLSSSRERPKPAPLAYPDVLAGLAGFAAAVELFDVVHEHREVSLAGATAPLLTTTPSNEAGDAEGRS